MNDTKTPQTVTVIPLNIDADIVLAFSELGKTIVNNFKNVVVRPLLQEMYDSLAALSIRIVNREPEENRMAKVGELLVDYTEHLAAVGYEAHLEANLMIIAPIILDAESTFHRLDSKGTACASCGKEVAAISELVEVCKS